MPPGKLWYLEKERASIYLALGKSRSKYGAIRTMKKPSSREENLLKVQLQNTSIYTVSCLQYIRMIIQVIFQSAGDSTGQ